MLIFNMCMGSMTPPVGSVLFVSCGISKITIEQVTKTLLPYFAVLLGILLAVTYIPALFYGNTYFVGLDIKEKKHAFWKISGNRKNRKTDIWYREKTEPSS